MSKKTTVLNNGTGNTCELESGNTLIGDGLKSISKNQTILGRYNDYTGDSSSDLFQMGGGSSSKDRINAVRVKKDGEVVFNGGGEVYMINPNTLEYCSVFMLGSDNRIKKVYLSK